MAGFVLGLDLGTSSAKVSALAPDGRLLGQESEPYPTHVPQPGRAEQDPGDWLPAIAAATRRLLAGAGLRGGDALALAISSAAHIGILLDGAGRPLRRALLWSDQRSAEEAAELGAAHGAEIFAIGRNWPTTTWTLPHLAWIARHDPGARARCVRILLSKDHLTLLLTGEAVTDPATAVSALLYDPERAAWSERLCGLAGIAPALLPQVRPVGAEIGPLTAGAAEALGLTTRVRVFNGTLDSTAETFAAGVLDDTACVLRLASAGGLHLVSRGARPDPKLISYPYPIEPYWLSQAGTNTCATAVSWAARLLAGGEEVDFGHWDDLAAGAPAGADGLLFHPYLAGERCPYWDPRLRASFTGLSLGHGRSHMARAVYEGTAFSLRDAASAFGGRERAVRTLRLVGGGTRSRLWCEIVAAVFDRPAEPVTEANSSIGAAMLALLGLGASADEVAAARARHRQGGPAIEATAETRDLYAAAFERYRAAQPHLAAMTAGP